MTNKERIKMVFEGEVPDRIPIFDLLCNDKAIEYFAESKLTVENGEEVVTKAIRRCLDATRSISFPQRPRIEKDSKGYIWEVKRWTRWFKERPFKNVDELADYVKKDIEILRDTTFSPEDKENKDNLKLQEMIGDTLLFWPCDGEALNAAYYYFGIDLATYLEIDYPVLFKEWIDSFHKMVIRKVNSYSNPDLFPVGMIFSDIAFKGKLICSSNHLRETGYFRRIQEIVDTYHQNGVKVVYHSDGNIMEIIPDLIKAGIDGLNPIEKAAGMDIYKIKELYGEKITLVGGVDATNLLVKGKPSEVREEVRQIIERVGRGGRFLIGSTTELGNDIPLENILAMIEVIRKVGKY